MVRTLQILLVLNALKIGGNSFFNPILFAICTNPFSKLCKRRIERHVEEYSLALGSQNEPMSCNSEHGRESWVTYKQEIYRPVVHGVNGATQQTDLLQAIILGRGPPVTREYIKVYRTIYRTSNTSQVTYGTCLQNTVSLVATKFSRECFVTTPEQKQMFRYSDITIASPAITQVLMEQVQGGATSNTECPESS
jgi:hypothetical protein